MKTKLKAWAWGLLSASLSGLGVGSAATGAANVFSSQTFNIGSEYNVLLCLKFFAVTCIFGAITGVLNYLAKSPLPDYEEPEKKP